MNTEHEFLTALQEQPCDADLKTIFADWLEEYGADPEPWRSGAAWEPHYEADAFWWEDDLDWYPRSASLPSVLFQHLPADEDGDTGTSGHVSLYWNTRTEAMAALTEALIRLHKEERKP